MKIWTFFAKFSAFEVAEVVAIGGGGLRGGSVTKNAVLSFETQIFMKIWTFFAKFCVFEGGGSQKWSFEGENSNFYSNLA